MRTPLQAGKLTIDITNACIHECSNCTRFCGHFKKPFYMDFDTFKRAVDSLEEFEGFILIMGGEPTLHPQFEQFVEYAFKKSPMNYNLNSGRKPQRHFISYREQCTSFGKYALNKKKGLNLLTCLPKNYNRYFELIHDCFSHQQPNDHSVPSMHQPILISRKELKIPNDKWVELRDNCWLQNQWCASITPKGAFFCEVAAAMDMLFDGPGGWPIEKGWWKRTPKDYDDQLHWCELCSMPVFDVGRYSNDEIDDISPYLYEKLKKCGNENLKNKKISIISISQEGNAKLSCNKMYNMTNSRYVSSYDNRFAEDNSIILQKVLNGIVIFRGNQEIDELKSFIQRREKYFDELFIIVNSKILKNTVENSIVKDNVIVLLVEMPYDSLGHALNKVISRANKTDWFMLMKQDTELFDDFRTRINHCVMNPGVLHKINGAYLFNPLAKAMKSAGFDGIAQCKIESEFESLWDKGKVINLDDSFDKIINPDLKDWIELSKSLPEGKREECLTKLDYIRRLILLEYYRAYIADRSCGISEKILALNECIPQLIIENNTESLKHQLEDAVRVILVNENVNFNDVILKNKFKDQTDIFSELAFNLMT
nr:hypothetical protein [Sedimentibacter sp.]